jgi:hypothetical protein
MYDSRTTVNFQQEIPQFGKVDATGWKTENGAINEAKQLTYCLLHNRHLFFHSVISFNRDLTEIDHKRIWKHATRELRKAILAHYTRELNYRGRIHYHLLIASNHEQHALCNTLKNSLPREIRSVSEVHLESVKDQFAIASYVTKMKLSGYDAYGKWTQDKHKTKRRLFVKECKLTKHGTIGDFWIRPRNDIWQECIARERGIAKYKTPEMRAKAKQVSEIISDEYQTYKTILRLYCTWAYERENVIRPTN